ncbi:hypothetical protein CR513_46569, partial [Mucuna pruriens]
MAVKVLISNDFQPSKGLGKELDGIDELVELQENPGRFRLGYIGVVEERRQGWKAQSKKWIRPDLYRFFTSGASSLVVIKDQLPKLEEWVLSTNQELDNWTAEALPELLKTNNINASLRIDNATLELNNANESCGQDEGEGPEEEALVELERLLEQERSKLQYGAEELAIINLGEEEER